MADQKVTALVEELAPALSDLLYMVDDPGGAPVSKKVTMQNVLDIVNFVGFLATMSGDEGTASGVAEVMPFDTETFDIGGYFNVGTYRWTPPAGYVVIYANLQWENGHNSGVDTQILKNGGSVCLAGNSITTTNPVSITVLWIGVADGDDFFEAQARQYSGGALDVLSSRSQFMGFVIPQS